MAAGSSAASGDKGEYERRHSGNRIYSVPSPGGDGFLLRLQADSQLIARPPLNMVSLRAILTAATLIAASAVSGAADPLAACKGYSASNVKTTTSSLTASLTLIGPACNAYGTDLENLTLSVVYETGLYSRP